MLAAHAGLPVEVLPFFNIVLVWNRGVSFGMFGAAGPLLLAAIGAAVAVVLVVWMLRSHRRFEALALGAVAGGGEPARGPEHELFGEGEAGNRHPRRGRAAQRKCLIILLN